MNAIFYGHWDPEFEILSRVLCFLECFLGDALPGTWSSVLFAVVLSLAGGEKPALWVSSLDHLSFFFSFLPQKAPFLVAPIGRVRASRTKTFTSHVSDSALSYLQQS